MFVWVANAVIEIANGEVASADLFELHRAVRPVVPSSDGSFGIASGHAFVRSASSSHGVPDGSDHQEYLDSELCHAYGQTLQF